MSLAERRRYTRQGLNHAALLEHDGQGARPARFRDVSPGGALVVLAPGTGQDSSVYARGDVVRVRFSGRRDAGGGLTHAVTGRVVRVSTHGLGVSFVNPPAQALGILNRLVLDAPADEPEAAALWTRLNAEIETFHEKVGSGFMESLDTALFDVARQAGNDRDSRTYFDALRLLRQKRAGWLEALLAAGPGTGSSDPVSVTPPRRGRGSAGLQLLEKDTFEDLLAAMNCLEQCERREPEVFTAYRRGLEASAAEVGGPIEALSPEGLVTRLAEAVQSLGLEAQVRPTVHRVLEQVLAEPLSELVQRLQSLLPRGPAWVPLRSRPDTARPASETEAAEARPPAAESAAPHHAEGPAAASVPSHPYPPPTPGQPVHRTGVTAPTRADTPAVPAQGSATPDHTMGAVSPNIDELPRLARRLIRRSLPQEAARESAPDPVMAQAWREALGASMRAESSGLDTLEGQASLYQDLRRRIPALRQHEPLGALREALGLVDAFWQALIRDPWLHPGMARQITRLRAWMSRLALEDAGWVLQPEHPVARLLDALGELWPTAQDQAPITLAGQCIGALLHAETPSGRVAAPPAQAELTRLAEQLRAAALKRTQQLVMECTEQEAVLLARRRGERRTTPQGLAHHSLRHWVALAQQWQIGDSGLLTRGRKRLPVSLAWVGVDDASWVFVDPAGERALTMTLQEFALSLHRGQLLRGSVSDQPLSARARRGMLDALAEGTSAVTGPPVMVAPLHPGASGDVARGSDAVLQLPVSDGDQTMPLRFSELATGVRTGRLEGEPGVRVSRFTACQAQPPGIDPGRFVELAWLSDEQPESPLLHPALSERLAADQRRQALDLWLWAFVLTRAGESEGNWSLRLSAQTLNDAECHGRLLEGLLAASVATSRLLLVIDVDERQDTTPGLSELLHGLRSLGLKLAIDAAALPIERWRGLPLDALWVTAPPSGAAPDVVRRLAALGDVASFARLPLVALGDAESTAPEVLAELGVAFVASDWDCARPTLPEHTH